MNGQARPRNQKLVPTQNVRVLIGTKSVFFQKELENKCGAIYDISFHRSRFKFDWEHNMQGVRTERRKLTCLKEFPNKLLMAKPMGE